MEEYDIEPFMPAVSPGAPVPAPKYVPFTNYKGLTPGNYFSHTVHPDISLAFNKGDYSVQKTPQSVVDDIYNKGLKVRLGNSKFDTTPKFRPAAWNWNVKGSDLGNAKANEYLVQRMGNALGRGDATSGGMSDLTKNDYVKAKYANRASGHTPPQKVRAPGTGGPTFIYKGPPEMLESPTEHYKANPGPAPEIEKGRGKFRRETGKNPYAGKETGRITKKPIGYFPAGSDKFMTKPGMMTGRMPMLRGIGGAGVDMFSFPSIPPSMPVPHETHDIFGRPLDQGAGFEPEMIPSPGEYDYEIEPVEYPDQGGTLPMKYGPKMVPNPRAGQAINPYGVI